MVANLALAPRMARCRVCKEVSHVEDVTMRLFDEDGGRLKLTQATSYVRSLGMAGSDRTLWKTLGNHRDHIERWMDRGAAVAPKTPDGVTVITERTGPSRWLDVNQAQLEVGLEASRLAMERLPEMEDQDLVAVMRVGALAAGKRGELESRGRSLDQVDALLMLAAGFKPVALLDNEDPE